MYVWPASALLKSAKDCKGFVAVLVEHADTPPQDVELIWTTRIQKMSWTWVNLTQPKDIHKKVEAKVPILHLKLHALDHANGQWDRNEAVDDNILCLTKPGPLAVQRQHLGVMASCLECIAQSSQKERSKSRRSSGTGIASGSGTQG